MIQHLTGLVCFGLALSSAAATQALLFCQPEHISADRPAVFARMVGELRRVVSAAFILQADSYFHGGTRHESEHEHGLLDCHDHADDPVCDDHARSRPHDPLSRLQQLVMTVPVRHLSGAETKEVLPWLAAAAASDRNNPQAYLLGAFWLSSEMGQFEAAMSFLERGLRDNPHSWEIPAYIGELYLVGKKDAAAAVPYLRRAWEQQAELALARNEQAQLLTFLAAAYERSGQPAAALVYLEQLARLFPEDQALAQRLAALRRAVATTEAEKP